MKGEGLGLGLGLRVRVRVRVRVRKTKTRSERGKNRPVRKEDIYKTRQKEERIDPFINRKE